MGSHSGKSGAGAGRGEAGADIGGRWVDFFLIWQKDVSIFLFVALIKIPFKCIVLCQLTFGRMKYPLSENTRQLSVNKCPLSKKLIFQNLS